MQTKTTIKIKRKSFSMPTVPQRYTHAVVPTYGRFDLVIERGSGSRVWDDAGREYLDFGGGIAVCSLGHSHPRVTAAITAQAATLVHTSNLYYTRPQIEFAERLIAAVGTPGKIFCCNSGAEANEGLIKLARRFGSATQRHHVITFTGSFHGRTMAGISATGQDKVKRDFGPLLDGFTHVPLGDLAAVRAAITPRTAAILIEPIQGEGGIRPAEGKFLADLRELCDQRDLLLLFDEVQCGLGRTGHYNGWHAIPDAAQVVPDGISWAKGIANGFPLGAFWVRDRPTGDDRGPLCDLLGPGSHGTTYGGNPVACAAGLAVFDEIDEKHLLTHVREQGAAFAQALADLASPKIADIRALGLMIGVEFTADDPDLAALAMTKRLMAAGLLVVPAGDRTIRFLPPLNVTADDIATAVRILGEQLAE
jgi:predicted acetylornithine/succinylornithine family transaminase